MYNVTLNVTQTNDNFMHCMFIVNYSPFYECTMKFDAFAKRLLLKNDIVIMLLGLLSKNIIKKISIEYYFVDDNLYNMRDITNITLVFS